jgi:hypothetical protein
MGQSFYDCVPSGTHTQAQAQAACAAFTGNAGQCVVPIPALCGTSQPTSSVCSNVPGASSFHCWEYGGPSPGTVQTGTGTNLVFCPASGDPTWN